MKKLIVKFVSENNSNWAIVCPIVTVKIGNSTQELISAGGWINSNTPFVKDSIIEIPESVQVRITSQTDSEGSVWNKLELVA